MSGFNFGKPPASSGQASGSIFGTSSNNPSSGGSNIFGGGGTGFTFGGTGGQTPSTGGEQKSLFGATTDNKPSGTPFGGASTGAGFSFGQTATSGTSFATIFGTPKTTPLTQPSFGSTTPAPNTQQPKFSFGNPSTTPAGPPPSASTFGASTGASTGSNLFGATNKAGEDKASKPVFNWQKPAVEPAAQSPTSPGKPPNGGPLPSDANTTSSSGTGGVFNFDPKPAPKSTESSQPSSTEGKPTFSFPTATSAPPATTSAGSTPLFGSMPSGPSSTGTPVSFGAPPAASQPAQPPSAQPKTSNLFGAPSSTSSSTAAPAPAFSFPPASSQPPSSSKPATASEAPKPTLFGGLGGGTSNTQTGSNLFSQPIGTTAPSSSTAPTTTAPATTSPFAALGGPTTTAPGAMTGSDPKFAASTSGPVPPAQSRLKNKTMDEILTRWATDLTRYTKEFKNHAETVAKWDQTIVDNTSKIDKLYIKTRTCEKQTMSVEMQLSAVENQQAELEGWLTKYENEVDEMLAKENANPAELGGPDQERERTYKLAEKLQEKLDDMGRDLESMVEEVNAANASLSKNGKADEPITQIVRILNAHLSQLQAIDQGTAVLQKKVAEAQKAANGLGYLSGPNGEARAAVDDFYRSYLGRR